MAVRRPSPPLWLKEAAIVFCISVVIWLTVSFVCGLFEFNSIFTNIVFAICFASFYCLYKFKTRAISVLILLGFLYYTAWVAIDLFYIVFPKETQVQQAQQKPKNTAAPSVAPVAPVAKAAPTIPSLSKTEIQNCLENNSTALAVAVEQAKKDPQAATNSFFAACKP